MRVQVDRAICIGSGQCTVIAPEVFAQDDNGISYPVPPPADAPDRPSSQRSVVREAEIGCPVRAIRIAE